MHMARYWVALMALLVLAACGTPTSTTTPSAATSTAPDASGAVTAAPATGSDETTAKQYAAAPDMIIDPDKTYTAVIVTTKGTIRAELFAKEAPVTVNNFVFLARDGFYDNVPFHRIIKGFMVQTGDPKGDGTGGPGYRFEDEPVTREYVRGTLAMANSGADTNGSQFFIVHEDSTQLPKNYTIFGQVSEGLDVLDAIADVPVGANPMSGEESQPQEEVRITTVSVQEQ